MYVASLRLVNFRSYRDNRVRFSPGINVIVGENASGKTNLLEAAFFALRAASPRTSREEKVVRWGEEFARVAAEVGQLVGDEPPQPGAFAQPATERPPASTAAGCTRSRSPTPLDRASAYASTGSRCRTSASCDDERTRSSSFPRASCS